MRKADLDPEHLFLFILTSLSLGLRWSRSKVDKMGLSCLGENWDLSTDFHCDFLLWASLVALWSPNVTQLFSCLLIRGRGPEAHCALWGPHGILWLSSRSPLGGVETRAQRRITRISPPLFPFSQLRSILMRFGQILQDLFEVLTKKRPKTDNVFQKQIGEYFEIF